MPGEHSPYTEHIVSATDEDTRIEDQRRLTGLPETDDVPEEEGVEGADVEERLDEDPETAQNRRDVPPTPENSEEFRREDG